MGNQNRQLLDCSLSAQLPFLSGSHSTYPVPQYLSASPYFAKYLPMLALFLFMTKV